MLSVARDDLNPRLTRKALPPYFAPCYLSPRLPKSMAGDTYRSQIMSRPPGKIVSAVRRAMWAREGEAVSSQELAARGLGLVAYRKTWRSGRNRYRARRAAKRVGLATG
jgi:hypothetical protein